MEVKSPCVNVCVLDMDDVCQGCGRTRDEIAKWWDMTNNEKQQVLDRLKHGSTD